jgi:hypothetical protein
MIFTKDYREGGSLESFLENSVEVLSKYRQMQKGSDAYTVSCSLVQVPHVKRDSRFNGGNEKLTIKAQR